MKSIHLLQVYFLIAAASLLVGSLSAQTVVPFEGGYRDVVLDANTTAKYIYLTAVGGDGGSIKRVKTYRGGQGAMVSAAFKIGYEETQIQPGSTIRFIVGGAGASYSGMADANMRGMGGGGGTGIAYKGPEAGDAWKLLLVAGGGCGAGWTGFTRYHGWHGLMYTPHGTGNGSAGYYYKDLDLDDQDRRTNAGAGAFGPAYDSAGNPRAQPGWKDGPDGGEPTGGSGFNNGSSGYYSGGWGFGAGGLGYGGLVYDQGGGGGYSGGISGYGGTSYLNTSIERELVTTGQYGSTSHPQHGYAGYDLLDDITAHRLTLSSNTSKCIDLSDGNTANGTNIQLNDCLDIATRKWFYLENTFRYSYNLSKCLQVAHGGADNGANVELYDCEGANRQLWIIDGIYNVIRSGLDYNKCLDLKNSLTTDGTNIQLNQCQNTGGQHWGYPGTNTVLAGAKQASIRLSAQPDKCIDNTGGKSHDGNNIQLWDCGSKDQSGNANQQWLFDGTSIRWTGHPYKCLDVVSGRSDIGANIQLSACNVSKGQAWIYDSALKVFRSGVSIKRCLAVADPSFSNGANLQLGDCGTTPSKIFDIHVSAYSDQDLKGIQLASAPDKCLDIFGNGIISPGNNTNVQLWDCSIYGIAPVWHLDGSAIKYGNIPNKCLDLSGSNTADGTNIQLHTCNDTDAQKWIYDVGTQSIRSRIDLTKCLDLTHSDTTDGTNIHLWSCNSTDAQQWLVDGVPSAMPDPTAQNQRVHLVMDPDKCIAARGGSTDNGTNIRLRSCSRVEAQYFTYDAWQLKMQKDPTKCVDLYLSETKNGNNIQIWDCNGTKAQQWIYDGFSKAFRSAIDLDKCLDLYHSDTADNTNIQIYDCNGSDAQQFELY